MELKKILVGAAISAATLSSLGGVSHAGEITGNDTTTPVKAFPGSVDLLVLRP